ncbi:GGDEF domain-containing protein [Shewanella cyperi]|uniref:GGDEF domain-containing protein n=1 Tax=Shewanella cyperi TaxID=2814292 RepID=UPI001A93BBE9|nr:GGDEF domain-containing protein [Shewanella cyperi]QSX39506.1 GGDEF domain-containing protein [Shewanella cyperi]
MSIISVAMLDIDFFKRVNDTHGHDIGDIVLKEFAHRLSNKFKQDCIVARLGGEEFVVAMPGVECDTATSLMEEFRESLLTLPFIIDDMQLDISSSIGLAVTEVGKSASMIEDLLKSADLALYRAKSEGRNKVCVAS